MNDPETAEALCPKDHPFGTKRPCLDTDYYETFNLPHVRLVDLRKHADHHRSPRPASTTTDESFEFDAIVLRHRLRRDDRRHRRPSTSPAATASR